MSYIGVQATNRLSPSFVKEDFTGDGSTTQFTLTNEVPGGNEDNVMVVLSNIVQEPTSAYTIIDDSDNLPKILKFDSAPAEQMVKRFIWYIMVSEHILENQHQFSWYQRTRSKHEDVSNGYIHRKWFCNCVHFK